MSDEQHDIPVIVHRVDKLERSDDKQWEHIRVHGDRFRDWEVTIRVLRWGVTFLAGVAAVVGVWLRGGWSALADLFFGR